MRRKKLSRTQWLYLGVLGLAFLVMLFFALQEAEFNPSTFIRTYGLLGLFVISIAANATILFPLGVEVIVVAVGANPSLVGLASQSLLDRVIVGFVSGTGAAIGEMTAYLAGAMGRKAVEAVKEIDIRKVDAVAKKIEQRGMPFIFLIAIIPFPFDVIGMAAGLIKFNPVKFFAAAWGGKTIRYVLYSLFGFAAFEAAKGLLGFH
ncbi:MAG: VTT domain-containing protein [Candidatus Diapherotrites archaeon]|uniref:VTT domain-containing protein n=1 Tax=Candidatus Iainarchaeum sp. TaxID=3101447 RepID=A0A8T4L674_9ARCH|nr:VTT domain-containing protein [Candidatus Diapherotrites archaeon]